MALGRELIRNLKLDAHGTVLERWLAHHLAELMVEAENETGPTQAEAEARATDIILRLWAKRRDLPAAADPLGGYRRAIEVLSRLRPEQNPWTAYAHHGGLEQVFHNLFDCMARIVMCSLVMTEERSSREVAPAEAAAMDREELDLLELFEWWEKAFKPAQTVVVQRFFGPDGKLPIPDDNSVKEGEPPMTVVPELIGEQPHDQSDVDGAEEESDEEEEFDDAYDGDETNDINSDSAEIKQRVREAMTTELVRLQQELAKLIDRWRANSKQP